MSFSIVYIVFASVVGLLYPIYGLKGGPQAKRLLIAEPHRLKSVYISTILSLLILSGISLIIIILCEDSISVIGLNFLDNPYILASVIFIPLGLIPVLNKFSYSEKHLDKMRSRYADVLYILPKTREEYHWSILVAFAAGICEEIVYRGFLFTFLSLYMTLIPAVILTNVAFGVLHFGTGYKNMIGTFFLGLFFSAVSILTGSLWPAILAHILVDVYSCCLGHKAAPKPD